MPDAGLRNLERAALTGGRQEQLELDRATCRAEGHVWVLIKMFAMEQAGDPYPMMRVRVCRRCLEPTADWEPGDTTRCTTCRSPVRVRKHGLCAECIIDASTQWRTPTDRRRFQLAYTNRGTGTHIATPQGLSLCGRVADIPLPQPGMPDCRQCDSARIQAHLCEKDNAKWEGGDS